ncbi:MULTISPECIES: hypothetical protein [unclassified Pseudomonas]|nr:MULTISPECIES: hypothetical protein [unclassified Pseudomonas]
MTCSKQTDDPRMSWSDTDGMNRGSGSKCEESESLVGNDYVA